MKKETQTEALVRMLEEAGAKVVDVTPKTIDGSFEKAKEKYIRDGGFGNAEYMFSKKALYCPKCDFYFFLSGMGEYRCPQCGNEDTIDLRVSLEPMEKDSFLRKVKDKIIEFESKEKI